MRLLLSLLLGMFLLVSPAKADAVMNPNSFYNGSHYVTVNPYHREVRHARSRHHARHHHHRVRRAHHRRVGRHEPKIEWRADLSSFGKGWVSAGGLIIDTGAEGVTLFATFVTETVKHTLTAVERVIRFFIDRGYPKQAAYAIAGHLRAESNFNTRDVGDRGRARFLAQWHPDRQRGLRKLAARKGVSVYDFHTNLEYIDLELRTSETLAYRELHSARDLDDAVAAFAHYERPQGYSARRPRRIRDWHTRLRFARQYAREYSHVHPHFIIGGL